MSAGIASGCTPCAAAPTYQQPVTTGGGEVAPAPITDIAPAPVATEPPDAGAQPAAPAEVSGGGGTAQGGGPTCYQAVPEPTQCGSWVPAPVAVGGNTPPDPIGAPGIDAAATEETAPSATTATTPASQLATWPEWQQHFTKLGLTADEVAKIGASALTDAQLAVVYEDIHTGIVEAGGIPGESRAGITTWSPQWEQKFAALGLPAEFIAELKAQATKNGSTDTQLEGVYQQLVAASKGGSLPGVSAWSPAWEQKFAALGLPAEFIAELKAQAATTSAGEVQLQSVYDTLAAQVGPGAKPATPGATPAEEGPGWNPQIEQAFRELGMPDEVIKLYAESGAPLSGLEAAYKHAAGRVEDFKQRGWMDKFAAAKVGPVETWSLILGDQPAKDEDLEKALKTYRSGNRTMAQRGMQLGSSLIPGGRLLQWALGKEAVSGDKIDRFNPMELGFAALSGLSMFAAYRGARTIGAGWAARSGGYLQLNGVDDTLKGMGLPAAGTASMEQAAMGATQTWGFKQKLLSLIPGTALHKEVVGLGHAEAAAKAFNTGGAAKLMADPDGALQVASLAQMFDGVKSGVTKVHGGKVAYLGAFKKGAPMTLATTKKGQEIITVSKSLGIGNGNSQLVGLTEVAGKKLGQSPQWLSGAADLTDDIQRLTKAERDSLGSLMAGNAARNLGDFSKDGSRAMKHINNLRGVTQPEWYSKLAANTASQWPGNVMPKELLDVLVGQRVYTQVFDESVNAIRALDRSTLPEGMGALVDDASKSMDEARAALDAAKVAGATDEAALAAVDKFGDAVQKIHAQDAALAKRLFPTYVDEGRFVTAQAEAIDAVKAAHAAQAATHGDEFAAVTGGGADEVAEVAVADAPIATSAVADAVEGSATGTSTIGATWSPANAGEGKFTGTVKELLERAGRTPRTPMTAPAPTPVAAAPSTVAAAAPQSPLSITTNARGEAVTGSGLIVPSYAAPVSGIAPADASAEAIQRLSAMMTQVRAGV